MDRERIEEHRVAFEAARSAARQAEKSAHAQSFEKAVAWAQISLAWSSISNQLADRSGIQRVEVVGIHGQ